MSLPYGPGGKIPAAAVQRIVDMVCAEAEARPTVLLAIGDEALREESRRVLVRSLFTVVEQPSGELSADAVEAAAPDAVLADVRTLDGWAAVRRLREDARADGVPVLGLVSAPREADHRWAREFEVECLVPVPFDPDGLLDLVERITEG
ncbi:MAG TPA: response regulator [Longimicrobiaceae bacterium]|jgi:CheY-like chemotaxis protein